MTRLFRRIFGAAILGLGLSTGAHAGSTDWVSADKFEEAIAPFLKEWMEPLDLAVRVQNGQPEYKSSWGEDTGPFSFNIYAAASRAEAEYLIQMHAEAENLIGGPSRLCLHKFARAVDGDNEYYLLYLVDEEQSGFRCISLPKN
jgi:hypothetical protein